MQHNFEPLSEAEIRVFVKLIDNRNGKQIADELCLAPSTVQNHTASIRKKFGNANMPTCVYRALCTNAVNAELLPPL